MIKKARVLTIFYLFTYACVGQAGSMGALGVEDNQASSYFVSAEALYAWKLLGVFYQNFVPVNPQQHGLGGRLAAGVRKPYLEHLDFSAEVGWGAYGYDNFSNPTVGWDKKASLYGFDLLLGAIYKYHKFDLFLKAGALFEHNQFVVTQNLAKQYAGGNVHGIFSSTTTQSAVLPELKVGGTYDINQFLGVTLAYMYAFGSKYQGNIFQSTVPGTPNLAGAANYMLPAFGAITFGLNYTF